MKTNNFELAAILREQEKILDLAEKQKRGLTADEEARHGALSDEFDRLSGASGDLRGKAGWEPEQHDLIGSRIVAHHGGSITQAAPKQVAGERFRFWATPHAEDRRSAFNRLLVYGDTRLSHEEKRALQADKDVAGGFLVPTYLHNQIVMARKNLVFMRQLATVIPLPTGESLGAAALDNEPSDPTFTSELSIGTEDTTMSFERRQLTPHPLAKFIKVSRKLLRCSTLNPENIVRDRLAYKFAVTEENAFLNGSGANQPLGVFVASANGINTGRDISTGNTATGISADNLINCLYGLKAQYIQNSTWLFHRDAIKMIRKLKDGEGNYLWSSGLEADSLPKILGRPYYMSEFAPNTFTTGKYIGIVGDFSFYWIADALSMDIQVLTELFAQTNQNGYVGRVETDGAPVLEEAFVRVKLA